MTNRWLLFWLLLYLVTISLLMWGLQRSRQWALRHLSGPAAQQHWEEWREEAKRQSGREFPVQRRVPQSVEPPALVLLRDHFAVCAAATWVLSTALFVTLAALVHGVRAAHVRAPDKRPPPHV